MTVLRHRVPAYDFESLAAGGADTSGVLRAGQISKRRLLLITVLKRVQTQDPARFRTGRFAESWHTLAGAMESDAAAADAVLLYPTVGAWGMRYLRWLQGLKSPWDADDDPGYFGGLVAVAALRCGLSAEVATRVRVNGTAVFPSLGVLHSLGEPGWVTVRVRPELGVLELMAGDQVFAAAPTDNERWRPVRRLSSIVAGQPIEVALDDSDPFRTPEEVPPDRRIDAEAAAQWQSYLDASWELLVRHHSGRATAISDGVIALTPLGAAEEEAALSASSGESFGGISLTLPAHAHGLATALVHEHQHIKLSALIDLIPLITQTPGGLFYAPWRVDPRPAGGLLQGAYAHLGLVQFWQAERFRLSDVQSQLAHFEFARWRAGVDSALNSLTRSEQLTQAGKHFVQVMHDTLIPLLRRWVPPLPLSLAKEANDEHWFGWRLRNLKLHDDQLCALALALRSGEPCQLIEAPTTAPLPGKRRPWTSGRLRLARRLLASPDRTLEVSDVETVKPGDLEFTQREYSSAAKHYSDEIQRNDSDDAWTGLVLTHRHLDSPAAAALVQCPETVRALHRRMSAGGTTGPAPEAIAEWVSTALTDRGPDLSVW